tara:strand:+ start:757 stop:2955 length:2199 start_codon:yes stop_codon:yes gene_type:complete
MANDIKIIVEYETVTKAKKETKDLANVTTKLNQNQNKNSSTSAKLTSQTRKLSKATKVQSSANQQLANSYKAVGGAAMVGGKKMNTFNMRIQQGGYQLQDFVVQMQSGTSFFTAFSQQGSQFAGIFGPTGAVLGAVIAIGSVIGALAWKAYQGSKDLRTLEESMQGVSSSASDIQSSVDKLNSININGNLTSASEAMISIAESSKLIAEAQFDKSITSFINNLDVTNSKLQTALEVTKQFAKMIFVPKFDGESLSDESIYSKAFDKLGLSVSKNIYEGAVGGLKRAFSGDDIEAQLKALNTLQDTLALSGTKDGKPTVILPKTEEGEKLLKNTKALIEVISGQISRQQKLHRVAAEEELALNLSIVKNRQAGIEAYYKYEERMAKEKKARDEKVEEITSAKHATRFSDEESLMGMSLKIDKDVQKRIDAQDKVNKKQDEFLAKQKVQLSAANMISEKTDGELFAARQINDMVLFRLELNKLELKSGDEKYNQLVAYKELMQEAEARTFYRIQLEKEAAEAKKIADAEAKRVNDILLDQYSRIEQELEDQAQKQKDFADDIANSFGDAFMSMADGTKTVKDAFKDMARDIIKQLYRILVVEQMVASISGAIRGSFGGGAPQGPMPSGNTIPYANGGVVGSPTTFPMSGGKTGLMGEAGPEAIMPLKRGANGKLGVQMEGGATTTVVQNFNFSANGDDSVKRIIAQAAPKIAQMTKSEIMNDRRRGGAMKATFG